LRDATRFRARSTSHTVAVCDGCTNIPLAAGRAQENENLSRKRRFRPRFASVRPPGSVRTDHVPRITVSDDVEDGPIVGQPYHGAFDHDPSAHIFPERDQQLSRQRHDRRLAPTAAVVWRVLQTRGPKRTQAQRHGHPAISAAGSSVAGGLRSSEQLELDLLFLRDIQTDILFRCSLQTPMRRVLKVAEDSFWKASRSNCVIV
jgi:hypothetical protein